MPITFPVSLGGFASRLRVNDFHWRLLDFVETAGTTLGQAIVNELAPRRWRAEVTLARMSWEAAEDLEATINAIGPTGTFLLHDPKRIGPRSDPSGASLNALDPVIHTVGSDNRTLRVQGLPAGFVLSRGDMMSIPYASAPQRRLLLQASETVAASGAGVTPLFEVRPFLRPGLAPGQTVTLVRPAAKVMFEPGSFSRGKPVTKLLVGGMAFSAIEVR